LLIKAAKILKQMVTIGKAISGGKRFVSNFNQPLQGTDDEEFSNFFLQDLKNLGASAANVLKKVQDMIDDKSVPHHYIKSNNEKQKPSP
jgi:hypothetical protein